MLCNSRLISLFIRCFRMSFASIPRTGNFSFTANCIALSCPPSERVERASTELVRALARDFPADKINEAIKRLIDRRYVVAAPGASLGAVDGYWASLGLPHEIAEKNLASVRVRIQSIDVQGAAKLSAALEGMGVRVVARSADLTVVLVNDYLEWRLAELNLQNVSDGTPWLLVQPSGAFPWWDRCSSRARRPAGPVCSIA